MKKAFLAAIVCLLPLLVGASVKLSEVAISSEVLGSKWKKIYGTVIDDLSDLSALSSEERKAFQGLTKHFTDKGVVGMADYSFSTKGHPLDTVTCRVFVFESDAAAEAWWHLKYEQAGWEETYQLVLEEEHKILDVWSHPKRIVLIGNVLLTAHRLQKGEEHLRLLNVVVEQLKL